MTQNTAGVAVNEQKSEKREMEDVRLVSSPQEVTEYAYQPLRNEAYAVSAPDYAASNQPTRG